MDLKKRGDGSYLVTLDSRDDGHLLVVHTAISSIYLTYRLTDDVQDWMLDNAPLAIHGGKPFAYEIVFPHEDAAFHFKMRWA